MQIFRVTAILCLAFFLSGCPAPYTNQIGMDQPNTAPLPHPLNSHKALVYLVQPIFEFDLYLFPTSALEGTRYATSEVYINQHYLGPLGYHYTHKMICFYADLGIYHLNFVNEGAIPETILETIHLQPNKAYFYGLSEKNTFYHSQGPTVQFSQLPTNEGKNYLAWYKRHQALPDQCLSDILSLPSRPAKTYYVMKFRNESNVSYQVTQNIQSGESIRKKTTIDLLPNQSDQFPPLPVLDNFVGMKSDIELSFVNKNNQKETPVSIHAIRNKLSYEAGSLNQPMEWRHDPHNIFLAYHEVLPSVLTFEICTQSSKSIDTYITCTTTIRNKDQAKGEPIY
jgi:hypothetical protein